MKTKNRFDMVYKLIMETFENEKSWFEDINPGSFRLEQNSVPIEDLLNSENLKDQFELLDGLDVILKLESSALAVCSSRKLTLHDVVLLIVISYAGVDADGSLKLDAEEPFYLYEIYGVDEDGHRVDLDFSEMGDFKVVKGANTTSLDDFVR